MIPFYLCLIFSHWKRILEQLKQIKFLQSCFFMFSLTVLKSSTGVNWKSVYFIFLNCTQTLALFPIIISLKETELQNLPKITRVCKQAGIFQASYRWFRQLASSQINCKEVFGCTFNQQLPTISRPLTNWLWNSYFSVATGSRQGVTNKSLGLCDWGLIDIWWFIAKLTISN